MTFEEQLKLTVTDIRKHLAAANIPYMYFNISANGRTDTGEIEIKFKLGTYGESETEGGDLYAVVDEYLRRKGWTLRFAPISLPVSYRTENEDVE